MRRAISYPSRCWMPRGGSKNPVVSRFTRTVEAHTSQELAVRHPVALAVVDQRDDRGRGPRRDAAVHADRDGDLRGLAVRTDRRLRALEAAACPERGAGGQ